MRFNVYSEHMPQRYPYEVRHKVKGAVAWQPWVLCWAESRIDAIEQARARWPLGRAWDARSRPTPEAQ